MWSPAERRADPRGAPTSTTCRASGTSRSRSTACSRSERRCAWHEYELTIVPAARSHAVCGGDRASRSTAGGCSPPATSRAQRRPGARSLNYQYRNRFRIDDYVQSAELYARLRPDPDHRPLGAARGRRRLLERLLDDGRRLAELHRELLPLDDVDWRRGFRRSDRRRIAPPVAAGDEVDSTRSSLRTRSTRAEHATVAPRRPRQAGRSSPHRARSSSQPRGGATVQFASPRRAPDAESSAPT